MTSRFEHAAKLRAMIRSMERSPVMGNYDQTCTVMKLEAAVNILDPPFCMAWGDDAKCPNAAKKGSQYCDLHREAAA